MNYSLLWGGKKWVKVVWYRINYFGIFFKWNHVFFNMVYSEKLLFKFCRIKEVWKKKKLGYPVYNEQLKENIFPITLILGNAIGLNSFPIEITGIV